MRSRIHFVLVIKGDQSKLQPRQRNREFFYLKASDIFTPSVIESMAPVALDLLSFPSVCGLCLEESVVIITLIVLYFMFVLLLNVYDEYNGISFHLQNFYATSFVICLGGKLY